MKTILRKDLYRLKILKAKNQEEASTLVDERHNDWYCPLTLLLASSKKVLKIPIEIIKYKTKENTSMALNSS